MRRFVLLLSLIFIAACAPVIQQGGGQIVTPAIEAESYRTRDGVVLPLRIWPAVLKEGQETKAVVAALHGFNDYSNGFDELAAFLSRRGITFYAYDQRGFGASPQHGLWAGVGVMTRDAADFAKLVKARHPGIPLFLFGESMGGAVAIATRAREDLPTIKGLLLIAPAVWARETMNPLQSAALWLVSHTMPWMTFTGKGLRIRASDNIEMLIALSKDPLIIKETRADTIYGLTNMMDAGLAESVALSRPPFPPLPPLHTLILYGAHDEIIPRRPLRVMVARIPESGWQNRDGGLRLAYYGEGFHMLTRDLGAALVWRDIYDWMEDPRTPFLSRADEDARERLMQAD